MYKIKIKNFIKFMFLPTLMKYLIRVNVVFYDYDLKHFRTYFRLFGYKFTDIRFDIVTNNITQVQKITSFKYNMQLYLKSKHLLFLQFNFIYLFKNVIIRKLYYNFTTIILTTTIHVCRM